MNLAQGAIFADFLLGLNHDVNLAAIPPRLPAMSHQQYPNGLHVWLTERGQQIWHAATVGELTLYCGGELVAYGRSDGRTADLLHLVARDWCDGRFDPSQLNGQFLLIAIVTDDGKTPHQVHILTDQIGTQHCYMGQQGQQLVIGNCFRQVKAAVTAQQLDWIGLTQFCGAGFFMEDRTYFQKIKIIRPATWLRLSVTADLWQIESQQHYWQWTYCPEERPFTEVIEEYDALIRQAVQRRADLTQERVAVGLSGGLDSRNLLGCLPKQAAVYAYGYGYASDSIELEIGQKLAQAQGIPFHAYVIPANFWQRLTVGTAVTEGFQDLLQARQLTVIEQIGSQADFYLGGLWGDVWHDTMGMMAYETADPAAMIHKAGLKLGKRGRDWLFEHLCRPQLNGLEPEMVLEETLRTELDQIPITNPDFKIKAMKTWQWAFRWSNSSGRVFQLGVFPRFPFYDRDLIQFFCRTPNHIIHDRHLQIAWFQQFAPQLASVLWQETLCNLYISRTQAQQRNWPRRLRNKAQRILGLSSRTQRNWEVQLQPHNESLQHALASIAKFFDIPNIVWHPLLADWTTNPGAANGYTVSLLLALEQVVNEATSKRSQFERTS